MKFEIDPNELTTDQRAHVAAFIINWPVNAVRQERIDQLKALATSVRMEQPTEEERLDGEQKSDLGQIGDADLKGLVDIPVTNLNAIFGAPAATQGEVVSVPSVPLDKEGIPWDSRIHASTKTFIADGSWKLRRGVDPAEVEKVKAQLKELMAVPMVTSHVAVNVPIMPTVDPRITTIPPAPVLTPTSVGYVPVPPAPKSHYLIDQQPVDTPISGPVGVPKSHYLIDQQPATVILTDLIARMSSAIVAGKMTQATVTEMCAKHGVSEFMLLSSRPDLLPLIDADMKAMGV